MERTDSKRIKEDNDEKAGFISGTGWINGGIPGWMRQQLLEYIDYIDVYDGFDRSDDNCGNHRSVHHDGISDHRSIHCS